MPGGEANSSEVLLDKVLDLCFKLSLYNHIEVVFLRLQ